MRTIWIWYESLFCHFSDSCIYFNSFIFAKNNNNLYLHMQCGEASKQQASACTCINQDEKNSILWRWIKYLLNVKHNKKLRNKKKMVYFLLIWNCW